MEDQARSSSQQKFSIKDKNTQEEIQTTLLQIIGYCLLQSGFNFFISLLSCLGSCTNVTDGLLGEAFYFGVFFLVAVFTLQKLVQGISWARLVYFVLGSAFISNDLCNSYINGFSLKHILLNPLFWVFNFPFIFGSISLLVIEFSRAWIFDLRNILLTIFISTFIVVLQIWNIYSQITTLKPAYDKQRIDQSSDSVKKVSAGDVYKDPEFNFEITFPWKVIVIKDPPSIYISKFDPDSAMSKQDEFFIVVVRDSSMSQFDKTYQTLVNQKISNITYSRGMFKSFPYFKSYYDFGFGRTGGSAEYYLLNGTTLYEISFGGEKIDQYEKIMETFTFTK